MSMSDYQYPFPVTAESLRYHNGFMRTQIGRRITVDFLMGANTIVQKTGYLLGVAQDYILINEIDTNDIPIFCLIGVATVAPELAVVAGVAGKTGINVSIFFKSLMNGIF